MKTGEFLFCGVQHCVILSNDILFHIGIGILRYTRTKDENKLSVAYIDGSIPGLTGTLFLCDIKLDQ
jgi:hypothetical protein